MSKQFFESSLRPNNQPPPLKKSFLASKAKIKEEPQFHCGKDI